MERYILKEKSRDAGELVKYVMETIEDCPEKLSANEALDKIKNAMVLFKKKIIKNNIFLAIEIAKLALMAAGIAVFFYGAANPGKGLYFTAGGIIIYIGGMVLNIL